MADKVHLVQCLCPERHCITALAYELREMSDDEAILFLQEAVRLTLEKKGMDPRCLLCGAPMDQWNYEAAETRFATLGEAQPALMAEQAKQRLTAEVVKQYRRAKNN